MNTFNALVTYVLSSAVIACPVLLARKLPLGRALVASLLLACLLVGAAAYWPTVYADLRLQKLGFDAHGMSAVERVVPASAREEAIRIYESQMGIGWPLKALVLLPVAAAYSCVAVCFTRFGRRRKAAA